MFNIAWTFRCFRASTRAEARRFIQVPGHVSNVKVKVRPLILMFVPCACYVPKVIHCTNCLPQPISLSSVDHPVSQNMASMPSPAEILYQEKHISDNKVPNIIATNAICFPIACTAVLLRFVSRRSSKIKYEADDWLIVAGLVRLYPFRRALNLALRATCIKSRSLMVAICSSLRSAFSYVIALVGNSLYYFYRHVLNLWIRFTFRVWETSDPS